MREEFFPGCEMDPSFELGEEHRGHPILPVLTSIRKVGSSAPSLEVPVPKQPCQGKAAPSMARQGWMAGDTSGWPSPIGAPKHTPLLPAPCVNPSPCCVELGTLAETLTDSTTPNWFSLSRSIQERSPKKDLASRVHVCNKHSLVLEV